MEIDKSDISKLVGREVRLKVNPVNGNGHVYYQGKLEKHIVNGWYVIYDPLMIYPDGTRIKTNGWKQIRPIDYGNVGLASAPKSR